jgi:hypothetical protein
MKVCDFEKSDADKLVNLYYKYYRDSYDLPTPDDLIGIRVAKDGDEIVGFGLVKTFHEAVLILDPTTSIKNRAIAVRELFRIAKQTMNGRDLYAFVRDNPRYEEFLIKHFGFRRIIGNALILDTGEAWDEAANQNK